MPPRESSWSSPDDLDPLALLDDSVWDLLGEFALPPIAGGALPGFLEDAWGWTKKNLLDPAGTFLTDVLAEIGRIVTGAVTTIASWLLKWVYHIVRFSLWYAIPTGHRLRYPSVHEETTQSPYEYLSRLFRMMGSVIEGVVWPLITWVWDRVKAGMGYAVMGFSTLIDWIRQRTSDMASWVWDQVKAGMGYAAMGFRTLIDWIRQRTSDMASWVWDQVKAGMGYAARGFGTLIDWIRQRTADVADWVWEQVKAGMGYVAMGFSTLIDWIRQRTSDMASWVWNQVKAGMGYVAMGFPTLIDWIRQRTQDAVEWLWDQVWAGLQWAWDNVISKIPEGIVAGAAEIGRLIQEAFEWLLNTLLAPVGEYIQGKLAIVPKFWRGQYQSMDEIWDDLMDPIPAALIPLAIVGGLMILPAFSLTLSSVMRESVEPMRQRLAAQIGTRVVFEGTGRELLQRGEWDEGTYLDHLHRQGFSDGSARAIMVLAEEIPGSGDLVRMGVREVFTPEIAERFGQFEDFPPAFGEWMAKQGYTDFWAKAFWGAHWDLPSVTQGFEMFHRDVIEEADLQLLLRALDVMPYWRDKLTEIAYRVITRVDVRRMYAEGVFDRDQVLRVYKDLGYKPEDAEALTEFVVLRYPPKGAETADDLRSLTVSSIKQAYARRLITHDDALERLMELDYSADDAALVMSIWEFDWTQDPSLRSDVDPKGLARSTIEKAYERRLIDLNGGVRELGELGYIPEDARLLLQLVDLRLDEQLADLEIDGLVVDYQDGVITDAQLAAALADLHVPQARVDFLLQREILRQRAKRRRLTLSQMKKALAEGLMDAREYRDRLDVMGYNSRDVEILVALNVESV